MTRQTALRRLPRLPRLPRSVLLILLALLGAWAGAPAAAAGPAGAPIRVALDAEFSVPDSTSAQAIRMGILTAIDEINAAGGLLGGRPLELLTRDNRSVPARGKDNFMELAALPDLLAVYCGKYSPVCVEQAPLADQTRVLLLNPWSAANDIVPKAPAGSYVFRLSLRDSWAIPEMLRYLGQRGIRRVGVLLPMSAWGRSNDATLASLAPSATAPQVVATEWYAWGVESLREPYLRLLSAGAAGVLMVANEREGSILVREVAALPAAQRVPIASHWGITGGAFSKLVGDSLRQVDLAVVQTFTLHGQADAKARSVTARALKLFDLKSADEIPSQVGFGHAYDLTHLLAQAVRQAGSTDRAAVRDALERLPAYDGLVARLPRPFSAQNHEALSPAQVFMGRFTPAGTVAPLAR
jgi:branched-chain amino acid transport system substrate-binding protein